MPTRTDKVLASGAIWGPAAFIASWLVGGIVKANYSPVVDAISRLAAKGAETVAILNTGLVAYGVGVTASAWPLRRLIGRPAAIALATNGLLTFGVLATPLDHSERIDSLHVAFAGGAYVALSVAGLLASRHFAAQGNGVAARVAGTVGVITGASLLATTIDPVSGLFQRVGLTTSDIAMAVAAAALIRGAADGE